uniref:Uncharacterized protein n=1 Tax=Panagrolaimus sp. ES5 TaxID=591445 RepID=A0AC34F651_9BILA
MLTASTPPTMSKRVRSDFDNCIGLVIQKNPKQAEAEFKKVMKKHPDYKDLILPKTLSLLFEICYHKREDFDEDLAKLMDAIKAINNKNDDDAIIPNIMATIFENLRRPDLAVEMYKIYFERYGASKAQMEFYFDDIIKIGDFDEQAKTALKLYHLEKSEANRFQLCVALYLQAASKPSQKEREMGFEFATKIAEKVCADAPEFLEEYLKEIKSAKELYAKEQFLGGKNEDIQALEDRFVEVSLDSPLIPANYRENALKKMHELFEQRFEALKNGDRSDVIWFEALAFMNTIKMAYPQSDIFSIIASFLKDLQKESKLLEKKDLIACIKFLYLAESEDFGLGTLGERINEYVERFGHEVDKHDIIIGHLNHLSDAEKTVIIDNSKRILAILKPYLSKQFEIGIETDVVDARHSDIVQQKDIKLLGNAAIPTTSFSLFLFYHHRIFLTDTISAVSSRPMPTSKFEEMIDKWIQLIDHIDTSVYAKSLEELIQSQGIIDEISATCFESIHSFYTNS